MFRHILLPLDLSGEHRRAAEVAAEMARRYEARLTLLHVIEEIAGADPEEDDLREFFDRLEERARTRLAARRDEIAADGASSATIDTAVEVGKRGQTIVGYAADQGVDLIVMSSRRLSSDGARDGAEGPTRAAWPTISHQVAMISPVSTLLVR